MSQWHEIKKEDIDLSDDGKTLEIFVVQEPSWGNHYAEIKIEDLLAKLKELGKIN